MILRFSFSRVNENGVLENLLKNILHKILHKVRFNGVLESQKHEVFLYVEADESELENFSEQFSKLLPISLFYSFVDTKVVESMPEQKHFLKCDIDLPFTHSMLFDFLDKDSQNYLNIDLKEDDEEGLHVNKISLQELDEKIELLKSGKILHVSTREGVKSVGIVNQEAKEILKKDNFTIMPCDVSLIQKMVIANQNELQALVSFEKPTLNLRLNLIYKSKNIIPTSWVDMRICDSLLLFLLCKRLFESKEEFIYLIDKKLPNEGSLLQSQEHKAKGLHVNVLENGAIVMKGENDYISTQKIPKFKEKAHERFTTILYEYNLFQKKSLSFFLSKKYDDFVMFYSEKTGLIELLHVKLPNSIEEIIGLIEQNENGKKLIASYKKSYKDIFEKALFVDILNSPNNIFSLLGIVGVLFGYGEDLQSASKKLLAYAKDFAGPKGPRLDIKLVNDKFPDFIDVTKFIQSGLSFKLAGVDDQTLSYGYLESISFFVSDMADIIEKEFDVENVSMCGELFEFKRLLENSAKHIQPNHKIYINRAFSLE